ncbi:PREDICTED: activating signal [Prunus dulcis]|uniref:PREDICTED: activating signal n=1 Tax=Prunus dulcis TaxID=3755 RepID=A0A5E4E4V6_PRUDU|nr:PREDICTED: activating signal [Prunus dulcis]
MCGRARCNLRADDIPRACHHSHFPVRTVNMDRFRPLFNASLKSNLPVVRREDVADGGGLLFIIAQHFKDGCLHKDEFKIVYVAPIKALAAEVTSTFSHRLSPLNMTERTYWRHATF